MSVTKMIPVQPGANLNDILTKAAQNLQGQGYDVSVAPMSPESAVMTVKKDADDGFKSILGLSVECRATVMFSGGALNVNIDHEWTNKIIAIAVGFFLCWVVFITGIVGAVGQNGLPEKISTALMAAANGGAPAGFANPQYGAQPNYGAQQPYGGQPYGAPQQPYQAPVEPQAPQQPYDPNNFNQNT